MTEQMIEYPVTVNGVKVFAQYTRRSVDEIFLPLLQALFALQHEKGRRILVMLAAPPGSGKSTLLSFLESLSHGSIQVIGMDGSQASGIPGEPLYRAERQANPHGGY